MQFNQFRNHLQKNIDALLNDQTELFAVNVNKDKLWDLYLDSFPPGTNEVYRD
jgi:hypothetical protein